MSEYKVFARKYRPQTFADLIGQEYLVQTLQNAIKNNQIAHAFLLTGIRGIGKTTTARIIAKALNCENVNDKSENIEPCGKCVNCESVVKDNHPDVIEMDAASRTGVDDIREIIQNANYTPTVGKYKIYIIDEVHMLSNNAFNALLKTLEEPPAHAKFIFATTETRKIPLTIISRCQRFDLKRVTNAELQKHLENICKKEEIKFEPEALETICNHGGGSVRDALSLLDQMRLVTNGDLKAEDVRNSLGYGDLNESLNLFESILNGEIEKTLSIFAEIYTSGTEAKNILNDLLEITYLVSKANILKDKFQENKVNSDTEAKIKSLASQVSIPQTSAIWQMLLKAIREVSGAFNEYNALEMILIRISHLAPNSNLEKIINSIPSTEGAEKKNLKVA